MPRKHKGTKSHEKFSADLVFLCFRGRFWGAISPKRELLVQNIDSICTDEYPLFYLQFMEDKSREGSQTWQHLSQTQVYKTWSGYAFENICLKHIPQIKKALGIAGVYSKSSSFVKKGTDAKLMG